jgi:HD-GYP domain-containing protein (c-di-GMP phosphodiesterase class II)
MALSKHHTAGDTISDSAYHGLVLDRLAKQAVGILDVEDSCIFVSDQSDPGMAIVAAANGPDEAIVGKRVPVGLEYSRAREGALVQLRWDGDVQGAISIGRPVAATPTPPISSTNAALLKSFAPTIGAAIWHAHARTVTDPDVRSHIAALTAALDGHDGYSGRHSHEVMVRARSVGALMGLDAAGLAELEVAALLHDVGKVVVPNAILRKPGPLTSAEHECMAVHPAMGAQMLARIPGLEVAANIVRYHHERWDGAGYPDGLAGTRIPLASRIISVCDSFEAMISERPYRRAMSHFEALAEMHAHAGWQFDPDVAAGAAEVFDWKVAA